MTESLPFNIWQASGITEHMGGIQATKFLLLQGNVQPGQRILDIGCGTGYTACYLARHFQARVVGLDSSPRSIAEAHRRVTTTGLSTWISLIRGDAHDLPLSDAAFDGVIAESVLVFCDVRQTLAQVVRVLKPGGFFAANELTFLKPPPRPLLTLMTDIFGIQPYTSDEWLDLFAGSGLTVLPVMERPIRLSEQFASHLQVDGPTRYMTAVINGLRDTQVRRAFFTRRVLDVARQFRSYLGYGLFVARKAQAEHCL